MQEIKKNTKNSKRLSFEDRLVIEQELKKGQTLQKIADKIGFHLYSVMKEVGKNGGRFEYDAQKAFTRSLDSRSKIKNNSFQMQRKEEINQKETPKIYIEDRISILEEHMQILTKHVKELSDVVNSKNHQLRNVQETLF